MNRYIFPIIMLMASATAGAQNTSSPYKGSQVTNGEFFLYNVESGMWLQNNDRRTDQWTTRAELDTRGFEVSITAEGNGYRLNPKFSGNHSINGNGLYMDTGDAVTIWRITPVEGSDISNAYTIESDYGKIGMGDDGYISQNATSNNTWQLVTREERIAAMAEATPQHPIDVTWLVQDPNFAFNDERYSAWNASFGGGNNVVGGDGRVMCNRAHESWNSTSIDMHQTISGIPDGTYLVSVQGYYRDGSGFIEKHENGTETMRTMYFANHVKKPLQCIIEGGSDVETPYYYYQAAGKWTPNDLDCASAIFFEGGYQNEALTVPVTGGELRIGLSKPSSDGVEADWTVFDNWKIVYLGKDIDMTEITDALVKAMEEAEQYVTSGTDAMNTALSECMAEAEMLTTSDDVDAVINMTEKLTSLTTTIKQSAATIATLRQTIDIALGEESTPDYAEAIANAQKTVSEATTAKDLQQSLQALRFERKINAADKHENVFTGNAPDNGEFYLYNVGQKQFLCGGSDWGAHAALGFPGIPVTLTKTAGTFRISTGLDNGSGDWLNYNGYCDTPDQNLWAFKQVEGTECVYNIVKRTSPNEGMAFNPYATTDAGAGVAFYATVGTSETNLESPDAQWILVSKADRDALLKNASPENPVDATYLIKMPGFNQREYGNTTWDKENGAWAHNAGTIEGRGNRQEDFAFAVEGSGNAFELTQDIKDLPAGKYIVSVQGFYRNGNTRNVERMFKAGEKATREAVLYANEAETPLPDITEGVGMAPGYGVTTEAGELPASGTDATNYFQNGLYKTSTEVEVGSDGLLTIGIFKQNAVDNDWIVVDNFRLTYLGPTTSTGITEMENNRNNNSKTYTIQGIEVKDANKPGIYIRDGRKVIVR